MAATTECRQVSEGQRGVFVVTRERAGALLISEPSLAFVPDSNTGSLDVALAAKLFMLVEESPGIESKLAPLHTNMQSITSNDRREVSPDVALVLELVSRLRPNPRRTQATDQIRALNILQRVRVNALTVSSAEGQKAGLGIFPSCAMLNHTCGEPSAYIWFQHPDACCAYSGAVAEVRAARDLEVGEELTIAYIDRSVLGWNVRRDLLRNNFCFLCSCSPCDAHLEQVETVKRRRLSIVPSSEMQPPHPIQSPSVKKVVAFLRKSLVEPSALCDRGVAEYCRENTELALSILKQCFEKLTKPPFSVAVQKAEADACIEISSSSTSSTEEGINSFVLNTQKGEDTEMDQISATCESLRRRVARFLAYAAVAEHDWKVAEGALESLLSSSALLFPYHSRVRWSPLPLKAGLKSLSTKGCISGAARVTLDGREPKEVCLFTPHLDTSLAEADLAKVRLQRIREERQQQGVRVGDAGSSEEEEELALKLLASARLAVSILCGPESVIACSLSDQCI
jgi:hypothetical protein